MKKGFTLSELLITMGIIGIAAAILAPAIGNIMPDSNKGKVLKVYNVLTNANQKLLNNPSFYIEKYGSPSYLGFGDVNDPSDTSYSGENYHDVFKYGFLLATVLDTNGTVTKTSSGAKFTTNDGIEWDISTKKELSQDGWIATSVVTIDVNPNNSSSKSCYYGQSEGCKNPDIYKFDVDTYGGVTGADPLTKAYLLNPTRMNDKKADYAKAATLD